MKHAPGPNLYRMPCLAITAASLIAGCSRPRMQSALHPAGPAAAEIAWLWWVMCAVFTLVMLLVTALLLVSLWVRRQTGAGSAPRGRDIAPPLGRNGFIVAGGVLLPVLVVTPLYVLSLQTSLALRPPPEALTVRVVGHMWWWEVRYPASGIVTANEIHIPVGQPVRLELASADVIHSFWVPELHGKRDMIPGIENEFWIQADAPGSYRGQCAEYCGTQHANMALHVVALPAEEFRAWQAARSRQPADAPDRPRGAELFLTAGCAQCHAVRGTPATGNAGPDLTHFGSRQSIGAGILPNTTGHLAGWIANPQAVKPGAKMPRSYLKPADLLELTAYLESLQ